MTIDRSFCAAGADQRDDCVDRCIIAGHTAEFDPYLRDADGNLESLAERAARGARWASQQVRFDLNVGDVWEYPGYVKDGISYPPELPQSNNSICSDGGPGAEFSVCELNTDCTDCGGTVVLPGSPYSRSCSYDMSFSVSASGILSLPANDQLPDVYLHGAFSSDGPTTLTVTTTEFKPLPDVVAGLTVPGLAGAFVLHTDGRVAIDASASMDSLSISQYLVFEELTLAMSGISDTEGDFPPIGDARSPLTVRSAVRIGGPKGFVAAVSGVITADTLSLNVSHAGGWNPFGDSGSALPTILTPSFEAALVLGPSAYLSLEAHVEFTNTIEVIPNVSAATRSCMCCSYSCAAHTHALRGYEGSPPQISSLASG